MVYLTLAISGVWEASTTVEIYMVYLTQTKQGGQDVSTTVEIYMVYLTNIAPTTVRLNLQQ